MNNQQQNQSVKKSFATFWLVWGIIIAGWLGLIISYGTNKFQYYPSVAYIFFGGIIWFFVTLIAFLVTKKKIAAPIGWAFYAVWGFLSLPFYAFFFGFLKCVFGIGTDSNNSMACGGDSAASAAAFYLINFIWILLSLITFIIAKKKIAAWIFGILLAGMIGFAIYVIMNLRSGSM